MMTRFGWGALLVAVTTSVAGAQQQQPQTSQIVAKALPTKYVPPKCELKDGHFLVGSGKTYLKTGIEEEIPGNRDRLFNDAERVIKQAIAERDQAANPAAWYYLGRAYLQKGDLVGADSAFTKAEQLAPGCKADIDQQREGAWAALVRSASEQAERKQGDSAVASFREAAIIYRAAPHAFYGIGSSFNEKGQADSAVYYYGLAAQATDTQYAKVRQQAAFNQGALLLQLKRFPEAVKVFEQYTQWAPNDIDGKKGLAQAYRGVGDNAKAAQVEQQITAAGGEVGVAPAGAAGAAGGAAGGEVDAYNTGATLFNAGKYAEAAAAFGKVLETDPYNREVLYLQANSYYEAKNGPALLKAAQRLNEMDPMNESSMKLLREGYKQTKQSTLAAKTQERLLALRVNIKVDSLQVSPSGATLTGSAVGREATTLTGQALPPAATTVVFEFVNGQGATVATQEVAVPALKAGETQALNVQAQGSGIVGWKYHAKKK